jgi:sigma-B regulation protein RsbQ
MAVLKRNNVHVRGQGKPMMFVHGFGCDQNMWRLLVPHFGQRYKIILVDLVGSGNSDLSAFDRQKYSSLHGYAEDICEVLAETADEPAVLVGHSVSAMIGLLANLKCPERFASQIMVAPSPCYINDKDYFGGFERADIEGLLETLESNYLGWSSNMAPVIMGAPGQPELAAELTNSFCRTDPDIARHFARVTFMSDHRADLPRLPAPSLILQCSDDVIAPTAVGEYMRKTIPHSTLRAIDNVGHCPHLSAPGASIAAMEDFLTLH